MKIGIFITLMIFISCSNQTKTTKVQNFKEIANQYLKDTYSLEEKENYEIYYDFEHPPVLEYIESKNLEEKTKYKFYKTIMNTIHMEYPTLNMIIAVPIQINDNIKVLKSPTFAQPNQEFLRIFKGINVNKNSKFTILEEIANLFKEVTSAGNVNQLTSNESLYEYELLWQNTPYRIELSNDNYLYNQNSYKMLF